jgi:hypothetical protein
MGKAVPHTCIDLTAVVVAVTDDEPRILLVRHEDQLSLPNGPFDPSIHVGLEGGLRSQVEAQTGLDLYYVEQLYTFGNQYRDPRELGGGPRVVSVAYVALTHEEQVDGSAAEWHNWYSSLPWEDWRAGEPEVISRDILPRLGRWVRDATASSERRQRRERVNVTFGLSDESVMDAVLCPDRYELLYEVGIVPESKRDARKPVAVEAVSENPLGVALSSDHRRILATALGRLRGKLAYRPVVFELLPAEFTLLQLQRVVEALSGAEVHKQNFRRLVFNADLVESIGRNSGRGRGRPAELFRFRREVLGEKLTVGLSRPILR